MNQELIQDVTLFVEVINTGSFVNAAKKMGISKPSVSRRINQLEDHLHTKLIKRSTRKLSLTESGEILFNNCRHFSGLLESSIEQITELKERPTGEIKIGICSYFSNDYHATKTIADFMAEHPGISIQLHSYTTSHDIDLIKKDIDLYFTDKDMTSAHLLSTLFHQYPLKVCASPTYINKHGIAKKPSDLKDHNCLLHFLYEKAIQQWHFKQQETYKPIEVNGNLYASRTHLIVKMARAGAGIALLPEFMISKYLNTGELTTMLDDYPCQSGKVYITTYREKNMGKKLVYFLKYIKEKNIFN